MAMARKFRKKTNTKKLQRKTAVKHEHQDRGIIE
jgi:hypothetical protein